MCIWARQLQSHVQMVQMELSEERRNEMRQAPAESDCVEQARSISHEQNMEMPCGQGIMPAAVALPGIEAPVAHLNLRQIW